MHEPLIKNRSLTKNKKGLHWSVVSSIGKISTHIYNRLNFIFHKTTKWLHSRYRFWFLGLILTDHSWVMRWEQSRGSWLSTYCIKTAYPCIAVPTFQRRPTDRKHQETWPFLYSWFQGKTAILCKVRFMLIINSQDERPVEKQNQWVKRFPVGHL